jgi:hypothetical protein
MRSEGNAAKNGEQSVGFSFSTMLQHTGRFWLRVSSQRTMRQQRSIPPYSPDLIPTDFYLFPRLKSSFMGRLFRKNVTEELKRLSQNGFQKRFKHIYIRWQKFVLNKGTILKEK